MQIIPVIDLKDGVVVAAQQGYRSTYQPIKSQLCASSLLEDVVHGFLSVYAFKKIYIADLNAITQSGSNRHLIEKIITEHRDIEFWIDNGLKTQDILALTDKKYRRVIGSENQDITKFNNTISIKNHILSLDFFPNRGYTGPLELIENSHLWPNDIIIMSLDYVGNNSGPDFERLASFHQQHPEKNFIAAGGVRNEMDLIKLNNMGVNNTLIASALHSGEINNQTIKKLISAS